MKNNKIIITLVILLNLSFISGCNNENINSSIESNNSINSTSNIIGNTSSSVKNNIEEIIEIPAAKYEKVSENNFNRELFYINNLDFEIADPSIVYVEEGEEAGYFYAFGTSDLIGCHGFQCWRSKDLSNWEYTGVALEPDPLNTWSCSSYFAPEVIYDEQDRLYYMFYSAQKLGTNISSISVAYSENVAGPYIIPDNIRNSNDELLLATRPVIDFDVNEKYLPSGVEKRIHALDVSPFIDPKTNKKYIYWSWFVDGAECKQEIFGMEMKDWLSPNYSTITQLTELNKISVGSEEEIFEGDHEIRHDLNEAPFMYYRNGIYFLTFSVFPFWSENYQVRLAISDNPLKGFTKLMPDDGGVVISSDISWDHIKSAGHHCFIEAGDQLFIAYHTFINRSNIDGGRALAIDEVNFIKNSKDQLTMHTNGPTYSLQPIPSIASGYKNIISDAKLNANNVDSNSNVDYLTDGLVKIKSEDLVNETKFNSKTEISLEFNTSQELKAIMVYNSYNYEDAFKKIDSIELEYVSNDKGEMKVAKIHDIPFDFDFYSKNKLEMKPGAAAIAEFENIPVKKVTLYIDDTNFSISEIKILAKENKTISYKDSFKESYTYNNEIKLNHFANEGTILGGTELYDATYGWDFTHDGSNKDSYVTTSGLGESYVYFKDVITTKFYAEGYISTFANRAYPLEYDDTYYASDPYPKIGMVVRNKNSSMYYYLDATNNYSNKAIGYVQSKVGAPGIWNWPADEYISDFTTIVGINDDIKYCNQKFNLYDNYVKFSILRKGTDFYMFMEDVLVFSSNNLRYFGSNDMSTIGFLGVNSPFIIKNYSIITNENDVNNKFNELL